MTIEISTGSTARCYTGEYHFEMIVGHLNVELLMKAMRILYKEYNNFGFYSIE